MQQLDNIQNQIRDIQMLPIQVQDHNLEASLIAQYEENMTKLTEFYRQRAKKQWATRGDQNTSFFHHAVLKRGRKNHIFSINDSQSNPVHDPDDITKEFVAYFQSIFRSSTSNNERPYLSTSIYREARDYTNSIPDK